MTLTVASPIEGPAPSRVTALVLAAGASRRFGGMDKRLARLPGGGPLLATTVETLRTGFSDVRVVIGTGDCPATLKLPAGITVIRAPNAGLGMGHSIADAVRALDGEPVDAFAICLGDMAWVGADTLAQLTREATPTGIVRPVHCGTPGHPVLFGRTYAPELMQLNGDQGGRRIIQRHQRYYQPVHLCDPGVLADLDHPTGFANPLTPDHDRGTGV
ncbi:nucleotidyltransferase family protein [Halomonadaceae bacterium KBTZ08]